MPVSGVAVVGEISPQEVIEALQKAYPEKSFKLANGYSGESKSASSELVVSALPDDSERIKLARKLAVKEKEYIEMEEACNKATASIETFHKQQQALFDEFVLLRQRYDEQKNALVTILWNHCSKYHPELREIPDIEDESTFVERDDQVGNLVVGEQLGEGQFATVRDCHREGEEKQYALKIIKKERITSFTSLMRVSNEIASLKNLKSKYIVTVSEVIQTQTKLYILTEKGGFDLFEFFDEHPDGVPEAWAKQITTCILKGVLYCHELGICHRDLKPENILLTFDSRAGNVIDLKLCDFGLSTRFKSKVALTDFCGSPGFFAPEMIIHGSYFGDKADIWSVGCIILELMLGHEKFCDIWMTTYDYDILQDKAKFTEEIQHTVDTLPDMLHFSNELNEFILKFLVLKSSARPTAVGVSGHSWLEGSMDEELACLRAARLSLDMSPGMGGNGGGGAGSGSAPHSPVVSSNGHVYGIRPFSPDNLNSPSSDFSRKNAKVDPEILKAAFHNLSERERRHMEEYILHHKQTSHSGDHQQNLHLPPIEPATPSVRNARKILVKGDELAQKSKEELANSHNHHFDFSPSPSFRGSGGSNNTPSDLIISSPHGGGGGALNSPKSTFSPSLAGINNTSSPIIGGGGGGGGSGRGSFTRSTSSVMKNLLPGVSEGQEMDFGNEVKGQGSGVNGSSAGQQRKTSDGIPSATDGAPSPDHKGRLVFSTSESVLKASSSDDQNK